MNGRDAYLAIAEELSGDLTLADLDEDAVNAARAWAKRSKKRWPPKPTTTGWSVTIHHP